jgi:hypothetical protein
MAESTSKQLGQIICEALDLDPMEITEIQIICSVDEPAKVIVTRLVANMTMDQLANAITEYELVPKGK